MSELIKAYQNQNLQFQIRNRIAQENYIMKLRALTLLTEPTIKEQIKDLSKLQLNYLHLALCANDFNVAVKHFSRESLMNKIQIMCGRGDFEQKELKGEELAEVKQRFETLNLTNRRSNL